MYKLKIKPKSYKVINELTADYLKDTKYTLEDIDLLVDYQFEFIHTFLGNPIKGKLHIRNLGNFEIQAKRVVAFLKRRIENFRKNKMDGKEYPPDQIRLFRILWYLRNVAITYAATKHRNKIGFYKPINIKTKQLIPKSRKK